MTEDEKVQAILERTAKIEEQMKTAFRRIEETQKLTETVHKLATSIELLAQSQKNTEHKVDTLASDVETIKMRPARSWDNVVKVAVTAVISAVIAFCLGKFGL